MTLNQEYLIKGTDYFGIDFIINLIDVDRPGYVTLNIAEQKISLTLEEWEQIVTMVRTAQVPIAAGQPSGRRNQSAEREQKA